ncbi:MAG: hypothetical protein EBU82_13395 [Flavobacteriia bacterium]|nr:hypothetical protein [Flavobacteriia bacterium]
MPKRTSINDVRELSDLNDLNLIVTDKRVAKRANAKKERRNRHYAKAQRPHPAMATVPVYNEHGVWAYCQD